jgi:predicted transcriptional regulator
MSKKLTLQLDDALHAQVVGAAERTNQSMHSWLLHVVSHAVFRQLTDEARAWSAAHPEHAEDHAAFETALARERGW